MHGKLPDQTHITGTRHKESAENRANAFIDNSFIQSAGKRC